MRMVSDRARESSPSMNRLGVRSPDQSRTPCCPGGRPANPCRRDNHWQMRRAWRPFEKVEQCENRQQELGAFRHFFLRAWCLSQEALEKRSDPRYPRDESSYFEASSFNCGSEVKS